MPASDHVVEEEFGGLAYDDPPEYEQDTPVVGDAAARWNVPDDVTNRGTPWDPSLQRSPPTSEGLYTRHSNRSTPSLQLDSRGHQQAPTRSFTSDLRLDGLHISDPIPRSTSAAGHRPDAEPYIPPVPDTWMDHRRAPMSGGSEPSFHTARDDSRYTSPIVPGDQASVYSLPTSVSTHHDSTSQNNHGYHLPPQDAPPQAYDHLYAAASSVLGGHPSESSGAFSSPVYAASYHPGAGSNPPESYRRPALPSNPYPQGRGPPPVLNEVYRPYTPDSMQVLNSRPSLQHQDASFSVAPSTRVTKAIDVNHPPYTRKYIEEYRARIKGDPDPETHFRYAKYLIDAAKKVGADAADQKAVRKYRDSLIVESLKVIRRLATQGETYPEAQFFLAHCHGTGMLGLPMDHERAYHLYLQAAKQNHASSAYRVAVCNEIGAGTRKDVSRAFAFYRKAASLGDTPAMYKLGIILLNGLLGQPKNPREAIGWLKRAAEQADEENPHALHELALLYEVPNSNIVVYDDAYAKELLTRAATLGYAPSQFKLGQAYEFGSASTPIDPRRSIAWYSKAAEKGDREAELALSGWYLTGSEGVLKQSDSEAYLWARRAANKGLSKAEYAVGYYAEVGIGVKQDVELAKRWYMRAAAQGNKRAMGRLTEMKREGNKKRTMTSARPTRQQANKEECIIV